MTNTAIERLLDHLPSRIDSVLDQITVERENRHLKEDGSYVTQGDLRMQDLVITELNAALPGVHVVSEELKSSEVPVSDKATIAVVDPIDGTENFTSGLPEWGVSIAIYVDGTHAGSLLGCPQMGLWLRSGQILHRFQSRIHGLSSSLSMDELIRATEGYEYRILGCCVYNMINVIRGSFCSFENPKGANSWDILAGLNLALEHGLNVTVEGKEYAGKYLPADQKYRFKIWQ